MKQFITNIVPDKKGEFRLCDKDYTYLALVRRIKEGDSINICFNNTSSFHLAKEQEYSKAKVIRIDKTHKYIDLKIIDTPISKNGNEKERVKIILMQWVLKGQHMDLAVRQCTEAGVLHIYPVLGEYSVVKSENKNQTERRNRIIKEARQQSGSPIDTKIFPALPLPSVLLNIKNYMQERSALFFMLSEKKDDSPFWFNQLSNPFEFIVIAIGSEGGISPKEKEILKLHNFQTIHFDTNVLRSETASIYAIAAMQTIAQEKKCR